MFDFFVCEELQDYLKGTAARRCYIASILLSDMSEILKKKGGNHSQSEMIKAKKKGEGANYS